MAIANPVANQIKKFFKDNCKYFLLYRMYKNEIDIAIRILREPCKIK
ncbi:hypothetical protein GCM10028816_18970 [Spirosoma lituiforme]